MTAWYGPGWPKQTAGPSAIDRTATRTRLITVLHPGSHGAGGRAYHPRRTGQGHCPRPAFLPKTTLAFPFLSGALMTPTFAELAKMFDHSLLQPALTDAEMDRGLEIAIEYNVASVCIKPYAVKRAARMLAGTTIHTSTVIGFPHGGNLTRVKAYESEQAIADGAVELDMVVNIGKVLSADWSYGADDIRAVVDLAHGAGARVKVIFENHFLKEEEKRELCRICGEVRADWVKTSTGYAETG